MTPADLKRGIEIVVPAGVDGIRKRPYRLEVDTVNVSRETGAVTVTGRLRRLSGAATLRQRTSAWRTVTFSQVTFQKVRLATDEDGA